jgi:hypothetical protein
MKRTSCLALCALSLSGCGFIFSHGPPAGHENLQYFSCTESNTGPILDIVWAGLNVIGALTVAGDPSSYDHPDETVAVGLAWGVVSSSAAAVGFNKSKKCRAAKQQLAARQVNPSAIAGGVQVVVITPQADTVDVGERVQLVATAHNSSGAVLADRAFSWSSSNDAIASVNGAGLVTAYAAGFVIIAARSDQVVGVANIVVRAKP